MRSLVFCGICLFILLIGISAKEKPDWAQKDIRDYSDADMERLFEQWEEDEEELPEDERPPHLRPAKQPKLEDINMADPEAILKASKTGKPIMMFVTLRKDLPESEVTRLTLLWQTSLMNNHLICERYVIDTHRVIYMFKNGEQSWEAKDFLIGQEEVDEVNIENKPYYGPGKKASKNKEEL